MLWNMDKLAAQLQEIIALIQQNALIMLKFLCVLWGLQCINALLHYRLNRWGIEPRSFRGLRGIFSSPFLHGSFGHLFFNSLPLFLLGDLVLSEGLRLWMVVSIFIIMVSGLLTWLLARRAVHVGSSTLVMGYFGYLLAHSYYHFNSMTVILALLCVYYFGGLFFAVVPGKKEMSWEGHLFGLASGILAAYLLS